MTENFSFGLKIDYLRKELRITQKVFFSQQVGKGENPVENFDWIETNPFLVKPVIRDNKNVFPLENEPYSAKRSFSGLLKHFRRKYLTISLLGLTIDHLRNMVRIT